MQIILNQDVETLGKAGEIITVKPGFARNYLIPQGMATMATKNNIEAIKKNIETQDRKDARTRTNLEALAERLNKLTLKFELKAGEDEKLFGSVTNIMIAEAIAEKGYTVDRKEIEMEEAIKSVGNHYVVVKLGGGFSGRIKIKVAAKA
ncbi:MAG: 50S ribosomal protein L9 [Candidatus Marinimicrobia bacterium]|jgi:large subunit ribosomal protein L9|nr:50S ribosomal protein L9 [Candidatus Neomarinimicrobiota bacterium]MBT7377420.1 50S ribosomal protein L9 [Candidatus Neomarinimicrobiota bacterium]|tara:strand:- start:298 stop:744 length:447 start_codon:yes stop_codon:yes gene_type:complete